MKLVKKMDFCRVLHAEENAIIQSALTGSISLENFRIYSTYFPNNLCAKMIIQVGIGEVIYWEPYPEIIGEELFFKETFKDIKRTQYEGVMPAAYFRLFKPLQNKKDAQECRKKYKKQTRKPHN